MASLAVMLSEKGHRVVGADQGVYPPMSDLLDMRGIEYFRSFDARHVSDISPDAVVVGNAISRGNPELEAVLDMDLPYTSLPVLLYSKFMDGKTRVAATGTHGKTTISGMVAWGLSRTGNDPSFLVGGILENFKTSCSVGSGGFFVVEGDEYDTAYFDKGPKFLHYRPQIVALSSVEHDHPDIYPDFDSVKLQFERLVGTIPSTGYLAVNGDSSCAMDVASRARCRVETYGLSSCHDWSASNIRNGPGIRTRFEILHGERSLGEIKIGMAGIHNVMNSLAAAAILGRCGVETGGILEALSEFKGVKRRLSLVTESGGVLLLDDFAHHPTAVESTLEGIRNAWPGRRIWALFEPRSWTARRSLFQEEFSRALSKADRVIIGGVYRAGTLPDNELAPDSVADYIVRNGGWARALENPAEIVETVMAQISGDDIIVILSNGSFGGLGSMLKERLESS